VRKEVSDERRRVDPTCESIEEGGEVFDSIPLPSLAIAIAIDSSPLLFAFSREPQAIPSDPPLHVIHHWLGFELKQ